MCGEDTIEVLKMMIESSEKFPVNQQRISISLTGKMLQDHLRLIDYDLHDGSELTLNVKYR